MIILAWISVIHAYIGAGIFGPDKSKQFINGMNWRSEPSSVRQKNNMEIRTEHRNCRAPPMV